MPNNEQKSKGPRALTPEEVQILKTHRAEHKKKMETDPEYRKWWEKQLETFNRLMPYHYTD